MLQEGLITQRRETVGRRLDALVLPRRKSLNSCRRLQIPSPGSEPHSGACAEMGKGSWALVEGLVRMKTQMPYGGGGKCVG